jgi:hypothetical protein
MRNLVRLFNEWNEWNEDAEGSKRRGQPLVSPWAPLKIKYRVFEKKFEN